MIAAGDQIILDRVVDQVTRGHAGIDIEAGDADGVVVVKHQPAALLVGVIKSLSTRTRIRHVGDVLETHALEVVARFTSGGKPLVRRPITDPGGKCPMVMDGGAVLGVIF